ncbi:MAG: hypothetical protein A2632_02195 [Candidatus Pacebacteria bacterium RIFCSPHIGHO2_01_FULL_46_16]|nr:MAG: hypothetical protein A2632_02195 [Candidatus Pacebacteria bacterium RIFCSPHIGHO2_01_FULL_46_16]OGJ38198.1 MAG: hypothetical protein A3A82_01155 [Candidatus Pacebacteria bacterium RIFCSPLOWO2_01_FULL_47_12]
MQSSRIGSYVAYYNNAEEFHELKREIFTTQVYYLELSNPAPHILDGGAHIGLSTLYFKQLYPLAKISAIEPLAENAFFLEKNIFENQLADVHTVHAALAEHAGTVHLYYDKSEAGWFSTASVYAGAWNGAQTTTSRVVPTVSLSFFLEQEHFDLVKLDIEGAELGVLSAARTLLRAADNYLIEVHERKDNRAAQLERILVEQGFTVTKQQLTNDGLVFLHAHC